MGWWSMILMVVNFVLFVVASVLPSELGYAGFEAIVRNPLQAVATVVVLVVGILAPILALVAVIKKRERSVLVFLVIPSVLPNLISPVGVVLNLFCGVVP